MCPLSRVGGRGLDRLRGHLLVYDVGEEGEMNDRIIRHPNGGGEKVGDGVHVSPDTFCNEESSLLGTTSMFHSSAMFIRIRDCQVFSSVLRVVFADQSVFCQSTLQDVQCKDVILDNVTATGNTAPMISLLTLEGVVAENCELVGDWALIGNARIPTGRWTRAPRFCRITGENGVDFGLTESTDGYAMLGCWRKPLTELLKAGPRLGIKHHWDDAQIRTARDFFQQLLDDPQPT